ncbi:SDR family NAD(P)-dependent oxidoreductase [Reichenbachiella versicolor]|uniref:SDR family NAD(P)-dependent oxidoreductase n=1 Tax=Reichenbachiella versicolor TaxID=1821036 RepID=UPI000D6E38E3|nr:SDR family NAD(P)-dependent oxidoreductase [Reichenbachiella versicolor]
MINLKDYWVLVTGASSGLGESIAFELASRYQANLVLVARREEKLEALKNKIEEAADVEIKLISADLSEAKQIDEVIKECLNLKNFYGAVLNAGMTYLGKYVKQPLDSQQSIIQLNIQSSVQLTDAFVKHFELSGDTGRLMVISSLAAKVPAPYQSIYSGTKAFLTNFYHSLKHELRNKKLKLSVFSPGGIKTEMTDADGFQDMEKFLMPVNEAAALAVTTFIKGSHDFIPGIGNRIGIGALSLFPTRIFSKVMGGKYLKSIEKNK